MSLRGLAVLIALLAAVISGLVWLGRSEDAAKVAAPDAPLVTTFTEDSLRTIDLACGGTTVTLSQRSPRRWRIAEPTNVEADPRRVHELLAALQDARVRKSVMDKAVHPDAFGLAPPACTVRLSFATGRSALSLRLGRTSPVGTERYAAGDDDRVVLTDGSLYGVVSRGVDGLREKRLIPVDPEAVTRIVIERPDGRLAVALNAGAWRIEAPRPDAASSGACSSLARAVASIELQGEGVVRPPGRALPARRLRVEVTARGEDAPLVALLAAAGIEGRRLGWREDGLLAGLVEESAAKELERPWESFRETRIASFSLPDVRALTIERSGTTLRIVRAGEGAPWSGSEGKTAFPVDGARVEDLLETMSGLTADGFAPSDPGTKATGTIVASSERGELARLAWGPLPSSAASDPLSLWITTPARPGAVFRIEARLFGPIPAKAADLAPVAASEPKTAVGS